MWRRAREAVGRIGRFVEDHPAATIGAIGVVFAAAYLVAVFGFGRAHGRIVNGDAIQYVAYLRSAVFDGDFDFRNDYTLLYGTGRGAEDWINSQTPIGRPVNLMSIGPAILWAPFYLVAVGILTLTGAGASTGTEPALLASVGLSGVFYATAGQYLTFRTAAILVRPAAAFWATLVVWLAGPAIYYSLVSPTYSHATSLFTVALFAYVWLRTRGRWDVPRVLLLGALGGLCALVRWQDAIILAVPVIEAGVDVRRGRLATGPAVARVLLLGAVAGATMVPQFAAWRAIYGASVLVPQGGDFLRWTEPRLIDVLFSLKHGLFSWTPALLVAAAGLPWLVARDRPLGWSAVFVLLLTLYVNAIVKDWWAGEAFGARRFVGCGVLFVLGLGALFDRPWFTKRPGVVAWGSVAAIVYNLLFLLQYQLFMRGRTDLVPYPGTVQQVFFDRLWLPVELVRRWLTS